MRYFHWAHISFTKWSQQKVPLSLQVGNGAGRHKPSSPARWFYWLPVFPPGIILTSLLLFLKALPILEV